MVEGDDLCGLAHARDYATRMVRVVVRRSPCYDSPVARVPGAFRVRQHASSRRTRKHPKRGSTLANSKSSIKRIHVNERRRVRNRPFRSAARTLVKKAEIAIAKGDHEAATPAVASATSMLDRIASKGVIHPNNAARRKSRLMKKYNAISA